MSDAATSEPEKKPEDEPKEDEPKEEDDGEEEEEEEEYVIERILKQKLIAGETQYLVKWRGYDNADDNTWETAENLEDTLALEVWMAQKAPVDVPKELGFQTTPLVDRPSASAPPRRPSVAVSRDTSTEMFDGEAASLDRLIKSSFDDPQSVPVPEALSDEARSVSKILRGRRDEIARVDTKSLTADLSLDPPSRVTPMPSGTGPISAPAGGDLDAVADAFDLDAEPSEDGALELAYDPRARRADTKPAARTSSAFLDDVTPDAFTSTTKILIAAVVAIVVVLLVVMLR